MYELLVRIETLFLGLNTPVLLGIGLPMLVVGLVLWLGGSRYSTVILGLLGAVVGSVAGLLIGQWLGFHLWLSMLVGAAVLAAASVLLRNVLMLVLAVLVIASVSGAGYVVVVLDRIAPQQPEPTTATAAETRTQLDMSIQSFTNMDRSDRLKYVDQISKEEGFRDRLRAMLDNTWQAVEPHVWQVGLSVLAGGIVAIFLIWLIKKALIALAYSVVGTATIFLGAQAALLGAGVALVSTIGPRPWALPGAFLGMTAIGWVCQLLLSGRKARPEAAKEPPESEK
jgi:hypothetical protein